MHPEIEKLEAERDSAIGHLEAELKVLRDRPTSDPTREKAIEAKQARLETMRGVYSKALERAKAGLDAEEITDKLRERRLADAQEAQAAKVAERRKFAAWKVYYEGGNGTREDFEREWPTIRKELMLEAMQSAEQPKPRKSAHL